MNAKRFQANTLTAIAILIASVFFFSNCEGKSKGKKKGVLDQAALAMVVDVVAADSATTEDTTCANRLECQQQAAAETQPLTCTLSGTITLDTYVHNVKGNDFSITVDADKDTTNGNTVDVLTDVWTTTSDTTHNFSFDVSHIVRSSYNLNFVVNAEAGSGTPMTVESWVDNVTLGCKEETVNEGEATTEVQRSNVTM